jgi:DNA-binding GntR family transcriptional regulator
VFSARSPALCHHGGKSAAYNTPLLILALLKERQSGSRENDLAHSARMGVLPCHRREQLCGMSHGAFVGEPMSTDPGKKRDKGLKGNEEESQSQQAYRIIEEMIVTLALPPGTKVSEKSLSTKLDIGRTPVREALQRLAYEGTIQILPRSGAVVSRIDIADHFNLIEVRREIERLLVKRAARLADRMTCAIFNELKLRFEVAAKKNSESLFMPADAEFNALLTKAAQNSYATAAIEPLQAETRRFWYLHFQQFHNLGKLALLHAAVAGAIADRNVTEAARASDRLVDFVEEYTYQTMRALKE